MSKFEKITLPLIDSGFSKEDIKEDTGFKGLYFKDVDRPYLDNHIFMLYKWDNNNSNTTKIFYKFRDLKSFYGYKIKYIDNEAYAVYAFTSNALVNRLKQGSSCLRDVNKARILEFWGLDDAWITLNVIRGTIACDRTLNSLPLEDYLPSAVNE